MEGIEETGVDVGFTDVDELILTSVGKCPGQFDAPTVCGERGCFDPDYIR
jgi:hypothetical protein